MQDEDTYQEIPSSDDESSYPTNKWRNISIIFGLLTLAPFVIYLVLAVYLVKLAHQGASGTEFIALAFLPFLFLVPILILLDVVLAIIYLTKRKPSGWRLIFPLLITSFGTFVLVFLVGVFLYNFSGMAERDYYQSRTLTKDEAIAHINNCDVSNISKDHFKNEHPNLNSREGKSWGNKVYINRSDLGEVDNAARAASEKCGGIQSSTASDALLYKAINIPEATSILNACKVVGFYYPGSSIEEESDATRALALTGIVLVTDNDGRPIRIHIAQSQIETMVPIARGAQSKCKDLQFWNGSYE
jgi:hypothetical protein